MNNFAPYLFGARYLNDVNAQYLGSGGQESIVTFNGHLGQEIWLSAEEAQGLTNISATDYTSSTPLLAGKYQLVKMKSANTITPARGLAVYWDPTAAIDSFIVTTDAPTGKSQFAGFLINAPTNSYYCWILVEGDGYLKGKASSLTDTAAVGDTLAVVAAAGTVDTMATEPSALTDLTDSSGGTANTTVQAIGGTYSQSEVANNFADVTAAINKLNAIVRALAGPRLIAYEAMVAGSLKRVHVSGCVPKVKSGLQ